MSTPVAKIRFVLLAAAFAHLAPAATLPPIWTSAVGTPITSWDSGNADDGLKTVYFPSGFVFPFAGTDYSSATVSTNGSIYFGGLPGNSQPQATVSELLQGLPRVAAAWYNIDAINGNGSILVNLLSNQAVFTWENVASYLPASGPVPASNLATFQITLDSDGSVIFAYQALNSLASTQTGVVNSLVGSQQAILGITDGFGATDPGSIDLSALATAPGFSYTTGSNTIYQTIDNNPPDNSNLAGLDLIFTPQTGIGWTVTSAYSDPISGQGIAPEPGTMLELTLAALAMVAYKRCKRNSN